MYRAFGRGAFFFALFSQICAKKIYFRAILATKTRAISYHELVSLYTWITQCMRCDRLTPIIFRASGSKFASWSAPRRARFHTRPPAGTSAAKTRSVRPAACSARRSWNLETAPVQPPESPHTEASPLPPCRSLTDRASAHLCLDTLHIATVSPALLFHHHRATNPPPQLHHRPKTPTLSRPSPTHSTTKSPIVLSSSPQPPANPNLHALTPPHSRLTRPLNRP